MSKGQHFAADGHSSGNLGHGGIHRVGGHGAHVGMVTKSPDVHPATGGGHTMMNSHGGNVPMGC